MRLNVKAALLSGLVLPGLGQFYAGRKLLGILLILVVNLFLLAGFLIFILAVGHAMGSAAPGAPPSISRISEEIKSIAPWGGWFLLIFILLWLYATIDALIDRS
jgi:hypothetical protein